MTNLEKIKSGLCAAINSMSDKELYEFLSNYDESYEYGEELPFPKELLFTCNKCHQIYGPCEIKLYDSNEYICLKRFCDYCKVESN